MILRTHLAIALAAQFMFIDFAKAEMIGDTDSVNPALQFVSSVGVKTTENLELNKWYSATRSATLEALEDQSGENLNVSTNPVVLTQGSQFNIMDIKGNAVLIGIDDDMDSEPKLTWVPLQQLLVAFPEAIDTDKVEANASFDDDGMIGTSLEASRHHGRRRGGMTYCLRDVRLTAARFTRRVPQGIPMASMAYPRYRAAGWRPTSYGSHNPVGTACFFGGGRSCGRKACGHAAIKISSNAWKGAGVRPTPFIGGRYMIGCLVPPGR